MASPRLSLSFANDMCHKNTLKFPFDLQKFCKSAIIKNIEFLEDSNLEKHKLVVEEDMAKLIDYLKTNLSEIKLIELKAAFRTNNHYC
jgi:hypothetical protein